MAQILRRGDSHHSRIKTVFCIFLALYPVLCLYTGFYRFTIGDVGLMLFTVLGFLPLPRQDRRVAPVVVFLVFTLLVFLLNLFAFETMTSWNVSVYALRLLKLFFYLAAAFSCGKKYFETKVFEKAVIVVGCVAAGFMFFQYIAFYLFGKVYIGHIPGLEVYIEAYSLSDYESLYSQTFRPCSLFLEPAMYVQYMIVPTCMALFSKRLSPVSKIALVSIFALSIVMSTSAQGLVYLAIVFFTYAFVGTKKKTNVIAFLFVLVVAVLVAYIFLEPFQFALNRLFNSEDALSARVGAYDYVKDMPGPFWLLGYGYGVVPPDEYMAGAAYVWYGCGILGVALAINMFFSFFKNADGRVARIICIIFFAAFFVTSLFYNYMLFWFVTLIISVSEHRRRRHHHHHHEHYEEDYE
jgi:hypothetical protein